MTDPDKPDSDDPAATTALSKKPPLTSQTFPFKAAAIGVGCALAVGLIIGGVVGFLARPAVATTSEYQALRSDMNDKLVEAGKQNDVLNTRLGVAVDKASAADAKRAELDTRDAALKKAEERLKADQAALDARTKQVQDSQFSDGVHLVGTNVAPGVYSISNGSNCYYAWKSGTGSDAGIIDNNIVSGPATVTLKAGDVFETNRCGTWTKVG
jgi:hypothetical protein